MGLRQRVASLTLDCNGVFAIKACTCRGLQGNTPHDVSPWKKQGIMCCAVIIPCRVYTWPCLKRLLISGLLVLVDAYIEKNLHAVPRRQKGGKGNKWSRV